MKSFWGTGNIFFLLVWSYTVIYFSFSLYWTFMLYSLFDVCYISQFKHKILKFMRLDKIIENKILHKFNKLK